MPASSEAQRGAAGAALAAKRSGSTGTLQGASKDMHESMSEEQLEDYASKSTEWQSNQMNPGSEESLIKSINTYLKQGISPLSVPPEKRFYTPQGTHTGPRGGTFSVIGTEVDPEGNRITPAATPASGGPPAPHDITTLPALPQVGSAPEAAEWQPPTHIPRMSESEADADIQQNPYKYFDQTDARWLRFKDKYIDQWQDTSMTPEELEELPTMAAETYGMMERSRIAGDLKNKAKKERKQKKGAKGMREHFDRRRGAFPAEEDPPDYPMGKSRDTVYSEAAIISKLDMYLKR